MITNHENNRDDHRREQIASNLVKAARRDALQAIFARSRGNFLRNEPRDQILCLFATESHEDSVEVLDLSRLSDSSIDSDIEDHGIEGKDSSASVKGNFS